MNMKNRMCEKDNLLIKALKGRANIYRLIGSFDNAIKDLQRIIQFSAGRGCIELPLIPETMIEISNIFSKGRSDYVTAEKIAKELGDKRTLSQIYSDLSRLYFEENNYKKAIKFSKKALSLAEGKGAKLKIAIALTALGMALSMQDAEEAVSYLKEAVTLAKKEKMELEYAKALYELTKVLKMQNKVTRAENYLKNAIKIFKKSGTTGWIKKAKLLAKEMK